MEFGLGFVVLAVRLVRPREDRASCVALAAVFKSCISGEIVGSCSLSKAPFTIVVGVVEDAAGFAGEWRCFEYGRGFRLLPVDVKSCLYLPLYF